MRLPSHETGFDLADSLHPARYRDNAVQRNGEAGLSAGLSREAFPKIANSAERSQRLRTVPYWGGEGNMLLFGFNGRATRNFLILLVSMLVGR